MRRSWVKLIVLIAVLIGVCVTGAPGGQMRLDDQKLARQLSEMGMFELLEGLAERMEDPTQARYMLARGKLTRVSAGGLEPDRRDQLLDEAISQIEELVDSRTTFDDPQELLAYYRLVLDLIEAKGILKARPYALRMMYLQAGPADRAALASITESVIPRIDKLNRQINDTLVDWGADLKKLVTVLPELDTLRENLRYKSAWVKFYRAMVLPAGGEKRRLLQDAIDAADRFARAEAASGVKYWSALLAGMCRREMMSDFASADRSLRAADVGPAGAAVRAQAMFEIARNLADWGRYEQALEAARRFRTLAPKLLAESAASFELDVQATMLEEYLHRKWASAAGDETDARAHLLAADKVLLDFLTRYEAQPAVRDAFFEVLAGKHPDAESQPDASSVILLALASTQLAGEDVQSLAGAENLLNRILQRDDQTSLAVQPDAIWQLAMLMNARRQNVEAGRLFTRLAERFPLHCLALKAAKNAVYTFVGVIEARRRANEVIAASLRRDFIEALEVLLTSWGGQEGLSKWYFDLGWQYQQLAGEGDYELMRKAIDAYGRVPSSCPDWMQARYLALKLQTMLLDAPAGLRADPVSLVARLDRYGADAAATATACEDESLAKSLREWGALAEFQAARCLYERLDRKAEALVRLRNLSNRWPDTDALQIAWEFEITKLVEQERTDEAISKVELFSSKYPAESAGLIRLVASQLRRRIDKMRKDGSQAERLKMYGEVFHRFAERLFAEGQAKRLPPAEMYPLRQMRAEAMLAVGRPEDALSLFQQCVEYDAAERAKAAARIDREIDGKIAAVRSADGDVAAVRRMVDDYYAAVTDSGLVSRELGPGDRLAKTVQYLRDASTPAEQADRLAATVEVLVEALEALRDALKRSLPIDAHNTLGLARAKMACGDYGGALVCYNELVRNMNRSENESMYWAAQLERCECMFEAFRADRQEMKRLIVLLRQLELADRAMGGLREEFLQVRSKAESILQ